MFYDTILVLKIQRRCFNLPYINGLKADILYQCFQNVMILLNEVDVNIVAVLMDNFSANRKFFMHHLCDGERKPYITNPLNGKKLFIVFDPTHNMKNVYNNFISRKVFVCPLFPSFFPCETTAKFDDLYQVYENERTKILKLAPRLNSSVLWPTNLEKVNVKLANSCFHESTINALRHYGYIETADVMSLFRKLWNVLNVKTSSIGIHKRDVSLDAIRSCEDWKLEFLNECLRFFNIWRDSKVRLIDIQY